MPWDRYGAVGEQHLAVGDRVRLGAAPGPAAGAAQDEGAWNLGDVEYVAARRNREVDGLACLLGQLVHGGLHRPDQVEAAQGERAKPDDLGAELVTAAVPHQDPG